MKMKKMLVIMTLVISATSFANMNGQKANIGKQEIMQKEISNLTKEQQKEFYEMNRAARKKIQGYKIQIEETEIQIKKELLKDKPNTKKLDKLSEKKASFKAGLEKYMVQHRIQVKEKFGDILPGHERRGENNLQERRNLKNRKNFNQSQEKPKGARKPQIEKREMTQESKENRLNIRKINLEIRLEMMSDKPDISKIEKLIESKVEIETKIEKSRLRKRIERNEKSFELMKGYDLGSPEESNI